MRSAGAMYSFDSDSMFPSNSDSVSISFLIPYHWDLLDSSFPVLILISSASIVFNCSADRHNTAYNEMEDWDHETHLDCLSYTPQQNRFFEMWQFEAQDPKPY